VTSGTSWKRAVSPAIGTLVFGLAAWILYRQIHAYGVADIARTVAAIPRPAIFLAALATGMSFLATAGYDLLAIRATGIHVRPSRAALAAMASTAVSNTLGFGLLTGSSVRYRMYTGWGVSVLAVTRIIAFVSLTFSMGLLALGAVALSSNSVTIPASVHVPLDSTRILGAICALLLAAYVIAVSAGKGHLQIRSVRLELPHRRFILPQLLLSGIDWLAAAAALYVLLPQGSAPGLLTFLEVYVLAIVAGNASQVPGGIGVFETIVIALLAPVIQTPALVGALLTYRLIYYLGPLFLGLLALAGQEILFQWAHLVRIGRALGRRLADYFPPVLTAATFAGGLLLLFSGATPAIHARLAFLDTILPLSVIELSHFLGSIVGILLLFLARALQRRLDVAYVSTVLLLCAGIVASLFKGGDYEESTLLAVILVLFIPSRRYFYRKSSVLSTRFPPAWTAAIVISVGSAIWLTFFANKHLAFSNEVWWRFALYGDAPRSLRAATGAVVTLVLITALRLLRPYRGLDRAEDKPDWEAIERIVASSPESYAHLAFTGDKHFLLNSDGTAFIMYGVSGGDYFAMGDPVGPPEQWRELAWQFLELADRNGGQTVFYEVGAHNLSTYVDLGLTALNIGAEARVSLDTFSLSGRDKKDLRNAVNRLKKSGYWFEMVEPEGVPSLIAGLKEVSDAWLEAKQAKEKGFALGSFEPDYLLRFPIAVVQSPAGIVAFANVWRGGGMHEISIDLMRHLPDAPPGVMDFLFVHLMLWGREAGYSWFNLGLAPLSGLEQSSVAPLWNRIAGFVFSHGETIYNFQGLRAYKQKFDPVWSPKYIALPGGLVLPRVLANLATLGSRGMKSARHETSTPPREPELPVT